MEVTSSLAEDCSCQHQGQRTRFSGGATLADLQMEWRPLVSPASMSSPAAASTSSDRRLVDLSEQGLDNAEEGVATVMEALLKA
jgi:hypothetical protein